MNTEFKEDLTSSILITILLISGFELNFRVAEAGSVAAYFGVGI